MASSGFYTYTDSTGVITSNTANLQAQVESEYTAAFGDGLIFSGSTPQGVLANAETLARSRMLQLNATVANQINPNYAGGVFLDATMALMGSYRTSSNYTLVPGNLTGVPGTLIPAGSLVQDDLGNMYQTTYAVTLAAGSPGTASVTVAAVVAGPLVVAEHAISIIVTNILGWETVDNPGIQASVGTVTQSDAAARTLRNVTLAAQGNSLTQAIISSIYLVPNVTDVFFQQNISSTPTTIAGVPMVGNSIYVCEAGGDPNVVALALNNKKSGGCAYNNATGYIGIGTIIGVTTQTATTVVGSANLTSLSVSTTGLFVGQTVTGTGIPANSVIIAILSSNSVAINNFATAAGSGVTITFGGSPFITGLATIGVTTQTGNTAIATYNVTSLSTGTAELFVGQTVSGTGLASGTTVASIVSSSAITVSEPAVSNQSGTTLTFGASTHYSDIQPQMGVGSTVVGANIPAGATIVSVLDSGTLGIEISAPVTGSGSVTETLTISAGIPQDIAVTDPYSNQVINVLFDNPSIVPIAVQVNASINSSLQNTVGLIKQAVVDYAAGTIDQDPGLQIGTEVSVFNIAAAIGNELPSVFITNVQISRIPTIAFSNSSIPISVFQQATIELNSVTVVLS
jgi:hypothetical protein